VQRYVCRLCGKQFQSSRKPEKKQQQLLNKYVGERQTLAQLSNHEGRSVPWIRRQIEEARISQQTLVPRPTIIIADTTFWGRSYGVCVFRDPHLKKNIWWSEVESERVATYYYGRKILEEKGWTFKAVVVDGRRGLTTVFKDILVQMCHFHQVKIVTKYLTRRPQTIAGQELRAISFALKGSNEKEFTKLLADWHKQWKDFINEKTKVSGTKHWYYTHKKVRGAYRSLERNLPFLFTYQKYPELNIPNTTNSLDGMFSQLKNKIAVHRGLRKDRRYKVICEILSR
jgi:hypothetical protein